MAKKTAKKDPAHKLDPLYFELIADPGAKWNLKKVLVLDSAIRILAHEGLENFSLEQVSKRCGIPRSHVVYYFPNAIDLLIETLNFVTFSAQRFTVSRLENAREERRSAFWEWVDASFDWSAQYRDHAVIMQMLNYYGCIRVEMREIIQSIRLTARTRAQKMLAQEFGSRVAQLAEPLHNLLFMSVMEFVSLSEVDGKAFKTRTVKAFKDLLK